MGGTTPIYSIPYPYIDEVMNATMFQNFANAVDTAIGTVQTAVNANLDKPQVEVVANSMAIPLAVQTTINTWGTPKRDNTGMYSAASPDRITIQTAGIYMVQITQNSLNLGGASTQTSVLWEIYQNAIRQYGERKNDVNSTSLPQTTVNGLIRCNPGDAIQVTVLWTGTGTANLFLANLAAHFVCPLV